VLYQLHLLPDRRQNRSALFDGVAARSLAVVDAAAVANGDTVAPPASDESGAAPATALPPAAALAELASNLRQSMQQLLRDQLAEQRRSMVATVEALGRRMSAELKDGLSRLPPPPSVELPPPREPPSWWPIAVAGLLAALPSIVLGALLWREVGAHRAALQEIATLKARPAASRAAKAATAAGLTTAPNRQTPIVVEYLPYGEPPFDGTRLDRLRTLASDLETQGFRGRIVAESFVGDFCLTGNAYDGFSVAEPDLPLAKCALVGNPADDAFSPAQRQSVAFANFTAGLRQRTNGAIVVEVTNGGRSDPVQYPEQREGMTAGQWNGVATQNNRVEFRVIPGA
jgi:hypothetical protein